MTVTIYPNIHVLCDASAVHAYFNESDIKHLSVRNKIAEQLAEGKKLLLAAHTIFELKAAEARRRREKTYSATPGTMFTYDSIPLNLDMKDRCFKEKIFDEFSLLRGMDLICACLAKLYKVPLLTCDKDFLKYSDKLDLILV